MQVQGPVPGGRPVMGILADLGHHPSLGLSIRAPSPEVTLHVTGGEREAPRGEVTCLRSRRDASTFRSLLSPKNQWW